MSDSFEQQDWVKFGVAGALSKQYAADQKQFIEALAQMLEQAMPLDTQIEKHGGLFSKKTVRSIAVQLGSAKYKLTVSDTSQIEATVTQVVRGIALKTETITTEQWIALLCEALDERLRSNQSAKAAIEKLLGW